MIEFIQYWLWKREARKAVSEKRTAVCAYCDDPIVPGDFVAQGVRPGGEKVLIHAGFHFSLSEVDAYCETGDVGIGYWDGQKIRGIGETATAKAIRTGEAQIQNY